jgi:hypothetical protein
MFWLAADEPIFVFDVATLIFAIGLRAGFV